MQRVASVLLALALPLAVLAGTGPASAQVNPFRSYRGPTLTQSDRAAAGAAVRQLLDSASPAPGQSTQWTGPESGNAGDFTIGRVYERRGLSCRAVIADIYYNRPASTREFTLSACRLPTGEWKIAE